ncbi:MAG TPA: phosphatidylglycerophosphatase A [Candidatus Deferrimicrobiaceae bacterium]|nr:phosphatidylglycerophosphatase A [Candidatus Deferrimicrobiaceae bacterium]
MVGVPQVNRFPGQVAWRAVASGMGVGYAPVAPGTIGSLLALPLWYWGGGGGAIHFGALVALLILSLPAASVERRVTGEKDPRSVVIDEIAGMLLAATWIPWGWKSGVVLFLLFRLFDVVKFGPAAWMNSRDGAIYVMADDLVAGLYANLACRGVLWLTG